MAYGIRRYMKPRILIVATLGLILINVSAVQAAPPSPVVPVDRTLEPAPTGTEEVARVFEDMIVVQRRAKQKAGKFVTSVFGSFDFSDGPSTMYGGNISVGYAFSEQLEFYLNYTPAFITNDRKIVGQVSALTLENGEHAKLDSAKAKTQYGVELLWAPAYGKDAWGPKSIVRSDTFFKLGIGQVKYTKGDGPRVGIILGKTFFLSPLFNFRFGAGVTAIESEVNGTKTSYLMGIVESGLVWYL